jgi:hypothetical protein
MLARGLPSAMARRETVFRAQLFRVPGKGGWTFAVVPEEHAPAVTEGWGRTPVVVTVDGQTWDTSVWRDGGRRTLLAVPKAVRGEKGHGDVVEVTLRRREVSARGPRAAFGGGRRPR